MRDYVTMRGFAEIDLADHAIVLSDLDGCLISGGHVHDGARDFVDRCGERLWIVSNNSSDTAATLSDTLGALGLAVPASRILLAGEQTVLRLAGDPRRKAAVVYCDRPLRELTGSLGIGCESGMPELVLLGRDRRFNLVHLEVIAAHLVAGAHLWATNLDRSHPAADGRPVPETGTLVAAVLACAGPAPVASICKPATDLIEIALARCGADRARALFVGDNAATDGEAARAAGIAFVRIDHPTLACGASAAVPCGGIGRRTAA